MSVFWANNKLKNGNQCNTINNIFYRKLRDVSLYKDSI